MSRAPIDILNIFIVFPGDTLFFLLVITCSQASVLLAYGHRSRFPLAFAPRRHVIATAAVGLVWLVMLGAAAVALYGNLDANRFMPPLERMAYALSLLLLGWAFLSAEFEGWRSRSNLIVFGAAFLLSLLFINTARDWLALFDAGLAFNASDYAPLWTVATACIALAALLLSVLNTRHIVDAPLKALFFLLFLAGCGWDALQFAQGEVSGNYQGAARLAYAGGMLLLPIIIHRLAVGLLENSLVTVMLAASQPNESLLPGMQSTIDSALPDGAPVATRERDSSALVHAVGAMLNLESVDLAPLRIVKSLVAALPAEIGALIHLPDDATGEVVAGWDGQNAKTLACEPLDMRRHPTLLAAAKRGDAVTLLPDHHNDELRDLFKRLGIDGLASVAAQPMSRQGLPYSMLLVASPYSQARLDERHRELLAELAIIAGHILAESGAKPSETVAPTAAKGSVMLAEPAAEMPDRDTVIRLRREMTASLQTAAERAHRLDLQIGGLQKQLQDEQERLLDYVAQSQAGENARADANSALRQQGLLQAQADAEARDLVDAEAALRLLTANDNQDSQAQEYLHKQFNLLLNTRDRLRRQISGLAALRRATPPEAQATLRLQLQDEAAQLALQSDQLRRRRNAVSSKLRELGADDFGATLLPAFAQIRAERHAWRQLLASARAQLDDRETRRQALRDGGAGDMQTLESQLKQITADHDQLLESREALRREKLHLQDTFAEQVHEKEQLANALQDLEARFAEEEARQAAVQKRFDALAEERDNLLAIRDTLTAKVGELLDDDSPRGAAADLQNEVESLRETVARLSQQREDLALDLTEARQHEAQAASSGPRAAEGGTERAALWRDARATIDNLRAYTDLLLGESLGILGAAQETVLRLASEEAAHMAATLGIAPREAVLQSGRPPKDECYDIASAITEVIIDARARYAARNLLIELRLDDDLSPPHADWFGLRYMLEQLIANACMASPPAATVRVSARAGDASLPRAKQTIAALQVCVQDAGEGIAAADIPRVFSRAYLREYPAIQGLGDNGVGMSIARALALASKGDIRVSSEQNHGATFQLVLPLHTEP